MLGRQAGSLLRLPIHARLIPRSSAPFQSTSGPQCLLSRAISFSVQRSYATPGRPRKAVGEPSRPVKRAAKRQARSTTTSDAASKQVKGKKKAAGRPKKKAAPKKPQKKVLTEEQKAKKAAKAEKDKLKELKAQALSPPPVRQKSAWTMFVAENTKGKPAPGTSQTNKLAEAAREWKNASPAQHEHYNHLAHQAYEEDQAAFKKWVESHTPAEIKQANNARAQLRRKLHKDSSKRTSKYKAIADERAPKKPASGWILFSVNRQNSGDFKNIAIGERTKLISKEWNALAESEKKKYNDLSSQDYSRYSSEHKDTFGYMPPFVNNGLQSAAASA